MKGNGSDPGLYIFDLDGTLVDAFDDINAAVNHALSPLGIPTLSTDQTRGFVGNGARRLLEQVIMKYGTGEQKRTGGELARECVSAWLEYYLAHPADHARLYDGIREALEALRSRGCRLAVLSNKMHDVTVRILEDMGIAGLFEVIQGESPSLPKKPAPDGIQAIMSRLGTPAEETVMIGDSEPDVRAGLSAGCMAWGVSWGLGRREDFAVWGAHRILDAPGDLAERGVK